MSTQGTPISEVSVTVAQPREAGRAARQMRVALRKGKPEQVQEQSAATPSAWQARLDDAVLGSPLQTVVLATALAATLGLLGRRNRPMRRAGTAPLPNPTSSSDRPQRRGYPCSTQSPS